MTGGFVTALGSGIGDPYIVAVEPEQRDRLVRLALRDSDHGGIAARNHLRAQFYVDDRPLLPGERLSTRRWMEVGYFAKFGAALFIDETTPEGADWAWIAVPQRRIADLPGVYYDQDSQTQFPPRCVMPIDELREVVVEWVRAGERPTSVDWLVVNNFRWKLDGAGDIVTSDDQRNMR
ncbi:Imm1 family immunity protein [Actinokineospora sp.]|uniref:Imm1 family immunity protein n=1 Tax=Actinokineospora sp. TaxID=1872133 RepID=UPI004037D397